jgi:hypothetical protein
MDRRAQAAVDFLMTYGWAMVALALVLGALFLIFDFNPGEKIPESCSFGGSFRCVDFQITRAGLLTLSLKNIVGTAISVNSTVCEIDGQRLFQQNSAEIPSGGSFNISCDLNKTVQKKSKVDVAIIFYKRGMSLPSSSDGVVVATPQ